MTDLTRDAAWVLTITFTLSIATPPLSKPSERGPGARLWTR